MPRKHISTQTKRDPTLWFPFKQCILNFFFWHNYLFSSTVQKIRDVGSYYFYSSSASVFGNSQRTKNIWYCLHPKDTLIQFWYARNKIANCRHLLGILSNSKWQLIPIKKMAINHFDLGVALNCSSEIFMPESNITLFLWVQCFLHLVGPHLEWELHQKEK